MPRPRDRSPDSWIVATAHAFPSSDAGQWLPRSCRGTWAALPTHSGATVPASATSLRASPASLAPGPRPLRDSLSPPSGGAGHRRPGDADERAAARGIHIDHDRTAGTPAPARLAASTVSGGPTRAMRPAVEQQQAITHLGREIRDRGRRAAPSCPLGVHLPQQRRGLQPDSEGRGARSARRAPGAAAAGRARAPASLAGARRPRAARAAGRRGRSTPVAAMAARRQRTVLVVLEEAAGTVRVAAHQHELLHREGKRARRVLRDHRHLPGQLGVGHRRDRAPVEPDLAAVGASPRG